MKDGNTPSRFSKEQKMGIAFLLIFTLLVVGLGTLQLRNTIYGPFVVKSLDTADEISYLDENVKLQQIDTDQDGINDYEEINFYETSAYLPDSDSDGLSDKEELDKGTDPLCPEGKTCVSVDTGISPSSTPVVENPDLVQAPGANLASGNMLGVDDLQKLANDPDALRQLLLSSGKFSKTDLDKIDNETLKKVALESVAASQTQTQANTQPSVQ